jgi:hypothetical protein
MSSIIDEQKSGVSAKKGQKFVASIDIPFDEVLKSDQEGCILLFPADPGKFLVLKKDQYGKLSTENRQRYAYALEEYEYLRTQDGTDELASRFELDPTRSKASSRLEIQNPDPGFHYVWKSPDELNSFLAQGGQIVPASGKEKTMNPTGNNKGAHVISNKGNDELILCRIPKTIKAKLTERGRQGLENLLAMGKKDFANAVRDAKAEVVSSTED